MSSLAEARPSGEDGGERQPMCLLCLQCSFIKLCSIAFCWSLRLMNLT